MRSVDPHPVHQAAHGFASDDRGQYWVTHRTRSTGQIDRIETGHCDVDNHLSALCRRLVEFADLENSSDGA